MINVTYERETNLLYLITESNLQEDFLKELYGLTSEILLIENKYSFPALPFNGFVLYHYIQKYRTQFNQEILSELEPALKRLFKSLEAPRVGYLPPKQIFVSVPSVPYYIKFLQTIGAKATTFRMSVLSISKLYEVILLVKGFKHSFLPPITLEPTLLKVATARLTETDTMEELFKIELGELSSVTHAWRLNPAGFKKLKYPSAAYLLLRRPVSYDDRSHTLSFFEAPFGKPALVRCRLEKIKTSLDRKYPTIITANDTKMSFDVTFFGLGYTLANDYQEGDIVYLELVKVGGKKANGVNIHNEYEVNSFPIAPIYRQSITNKITTRVLTNSVVEMLSRFKGLNLAPYMPTDKPLWKLLYDLHFPKTSNAYFHTLEQLAFIELVYLQLLFHHKRETEQKALGLPKKTESKLVNEAISKLPYELTKGQQEAVDKIFSKLQSSHAENVMLSGDVGTGKTTVAQLACLLTVDSGYQAVLVGPTEILAKQLYDTFVKILNTLDKKIEIAYLSSNTKGKEKQEIERLVKSGDIPIVVGTHSVFNLDYHNLGLVVIDEQQKFGAKQREALLGMRKDGNEPDILTQTATPIPQSTAKAFYGDIDLVTLRDRPAMRKENITKWVQMTSVDFLQDNQNETWQHIFQEIEQGHQVFIVTPAVEESKKSSSVKDTEKVLTDKFGKSIKISSVHGKMTKDNQNKTINQFREGKSQILIASSIIEVGVDIPNATIMLVLDADRFGASSLHQIRGRVGRSDLQSYCYLVSQGKTKSSQVRLQSLVDYNNGFDIALVDLQTRSEGDLFGVRQSGESNLIFCDLADHSKMIDNAQKIAKEIYNSEHKELALADARAFLRQEVEDDASVK